MVMPSLPSVATVVLSQGVPADKGGRQGEGRALGQAHDTMDGVRFLSSQPGALANSQHNDRYLLGPEPNVHSHPTPRVLAAPRLPSCEHDWRTTCWAATTLKTRLRAASAREDPAHGLGPEAAPTCALFCSDPLVMTADRRPAPGCPWFREPSRASRAGSWERGMGATPALSLGLSPLASPSPVSLLSPGNDPEEPGSQVLVGSSLTNTAHDSRAPLVYEETGEKRVFSTSEEQSTNKKTLNQP